MSILADHFPQATGKSIADLAADFLAVVFEAERRYVASGWFDPVGLYDAGYRHHLCGDRFADRCLGYVYGYLAACADHNVKPDVAECLAIAERHGDVPLDRLDCGWLYRLILETHIEAGSVEKYATEVARLTDDREGAARHHLSEFAKLCIDESRFRILIQQKGVVTMAPKVRNHFHGRKTRKYLTV